VNAEPAIFAVGTRVVTIADVRRRNGLVEVLRGAVGTVLRAPTDGEHSYWVRLVDGAELALGRHEVATLASFQALGPGPGVAPGNRVLFDRVILSVVVGSRAYGLDVDGSDTDRRGVYLPTADEHWSLYGVPEQIDDDARQATYWEVQKTLVLALKANPNVLECLWSPLVEHATGLGRALLDRRSIFLSKLVYQTYSGYVASQFKKLQADLRQRGAPKWKHVMHLLRLLLAGVGVLRTGEVPVHVGEHRDRLLTVRAGAMSWHEVEAWRAALHDEFARAAATTALPDRPDYGAADDFLRRARRLALDPELP
jgi:hypothetical protein